MKKSYLLMAAAATIFAACSETDFVNPVPETEQEIGFENHVGKTTRAEIVDEYQLAAEGGFVVWGYKTPTSNKAWASATTIFDGVNVFASEVAGAATKWTYTLKKYWDKTSTYNFYAAAPYFSPESGKYGISDAEKGLITINGVESALAKDAVDFLIDRDGAKGIDGATVNAEGKHNAVSFDFNHVMAKVSIKLQRNVAENITVNSITMSGWNGKDGVFTQKAVSTPTTTTDITEWEFVQGGEAVPGSVIFGQGYVLSTDAAVAVEDSYIMVPQYVGTLTFTLNYTIKYSDNTTENFVAHVGELEDQTWGTDSWTTYTIKVGPQPIEFDVTSVNGFTNKYPGTDNPNAGDLPIE